MSDHVMRSRVIASRAAFRDAGLIVIPCLTHSGMNLELAFSEQLFTEAVITAQNARARIEEAAEANKPRRTGYLSEQTAALQNARRMAGRRQALPPEEIADQCGLDSDHRKLFLAGFHLSRSVDPKKLQAAVAEVMAQPRGFGAGTAGQKAKAAFLDRHDIPREVFDAALKNARTRRTGGLSLFAESVH